MATIEHIDTDATLETMTAALLQVTSVFLVQQNELQEVRERLHKELARVSRIQDTLTQAAQQHQDAVLSAVQSYESLSVAHEAALQEVRAFSRNSSAAGDGGPPAASIGRSSSSSIDVPHAHAAAPPDTNPAASSPRHAASVNRDSRRFGARPYAAPLLLLLSSPPSHLLALARLLTSPPRLLTSPPYLLSSPPRRCATRPALRSTGGSGDGGVSSAPPTPNPRRAPT